MKKVLIIEDERISAIRLEKLIHEIDDTINGWRAKIRSFIFRPIKSSLFLTRHKLDLRSIILQSFLLVLSALISTVCSVWA